MGNQQEATVQHMELYSVLCANLDGRGVWRRTDTCICMAESLPCSPETTTTLLIGYTPIQNKKFKVWGQKKEWLGDKSGPFGKCDQGRPLWGGDIYVNWILDGKKKVQEENL